ncbi:hypothetical protein BHM03_00034921 [Ensete ventricosum]|nr:hypothetical protein BHM03_00034921 [Ensete ventricosum]
MVVLLSIEQGLSFRHIAWYIPVRQLTSIWTATTGRYRRLGLFPPRYNSKSTGNGRFLLSVPDFRRYQLREGEEKPRVALLFPVPPCYPTPALSVCRLRAKNHLCDPSPTGNFFSLCVEKKRLPA